MANTVAEARHALTVPEQRLLLWLVGQIQREDQAFKDHTLSIVEMQNILGTNNGRLYEQMEEMCDRLQSRVLEILYPGEKVRTKHNWLHSVRYHDGEGRVTLRIHDLLAPVLLQLKERFCQIPLRAIFQLRGNYAIRWLERLYSRLPLGPWEMSVEELRDWLHADGELKATGHLVSRAIEYPRKELNAKAEVSFDYSPKRQGKTIIGWTFTPRANKPAKKDKPAKKKAAALPASVEEPPGKPVTDAQVQGFFSELKKAAGGCHYGEKQAQLPLS